MAQIWFRGTTRSGKTSALIHWGMDRVNQVSSPGDRPLLALAATNRNQRELADRFNGQLAGRVPVVSKTPLGFMAEEVALFFPLICEILKIKPQFPLRLRPELEQKYARELWQDTLDNLEQNLSGRSQERLVRRLLDLLQLAGAAGIPLTDIAARLTAGQLSPLSGAILYSAAEAPTDFNDMAEQLILNWRDWCLARGFLTYGIIYGLYGEILLKNAFYQENLNQRYCAICADDVHDYPAIARDFLEIFLAGNVPVGCTENPDGWTRLGLNADPEYMCGLAETLTVQSLPESSEFAAALLPPVLEQLERPRLSGMLPAAIQSIQTVSRAQLLKKVIVQIEQLIHHEQVKPEDIAIIAPGLDEVARYTLIETLAQSDIPVEPLSEQRPLHSDSWGRSPLVLLALIYPGCGRLLKPSEVADLLILLSQDTVGEFVIDPIRAGLLVDYCYQPDPESPKLLPAKTMPRGDRLGYRVTEAYETIRAWIQTHQTQDLPTATSLLPTLDQALNAFFLGKSGLTYTHLAPLRELTETVQHFFEGDRRLGTRPEINPLAEIIQMVQTDLVTSNPKPSFAFNREPSHTLTLATIFQYRSARLSHPHQFWLDAGSRLWEKGGAATLFGYGIFQRRWQGEPWSLAEEATQDRIRLQRILKDLLGRTTQHLYLCHSDLGINGAEQLGPLLPLVQSAQEITP